MSWRSFGFVLLCCFGTALHGGGTVLHAETVSLDAIEFQDDWTLRERLDSLCNRTVALSADGSLYAETCYNSPTYTVRMCNAYRSAGVTLKFAVDDDGHNLGYVAYLTKIEGWSGSQLLDIADAFYAALQPEHVFLWDAAAVDMDGVRVELRPYRVLTHDTGLAWYEAHGYRPATWDEVMYLETHDGMGMTSGGLSSDDFERDPDPSPYVAAREYLRGRHLSDLLDMREYGLNCSALEELEDEYDGDDSLGRILSEVIERDQLLFTECWSEVLSAPRITMTTLMKLAVKEFPQDESIVFARILAYWKYADGELKELRAQLRGKKSPSRFMSVVLDTPIADLCDPESELWTMLCDLKMQDLKLAQCVKKFSKEETEAYLLPLVALSPGDYERMVAAWLRSEQNSGCYLKLLMAMSIVRSKHYFVKDVHPIEDAA